VNANNHPQTSLPPATRRGIHQDAPDCRKSATSESTQTTRSTIAVAVKSESRTDKFPTRLPAAQYSGAVDCDVSIARHDTITTAGGHMNSSHPVCKVGGNAETQAATAAGSAADTGRVAGPYGADGLGSERDGDASIGRYLGRGKGRVDGEAVPAQPTASDQRPSSPPPPLTAGFWNDIASAWGSR
jgi:hypothetical protein